MNDLLLEVIKSHDVKVAFSISGSAIDQFEQYAPEVIDSFKKLAKTGKVEFLAETYSHSLVSLKNEEEFKRQVNLHVEKVKSCFGYTPKVFRNTELIYSDYIGEQVYNMGFEAMLTEGAKHILGWKSPNFVYCNAINPRLKLLLRNYKLSDDIAFRFSNQGWGEWPLTADKFSAWLNAVSKQEEVVNLFMDYETFGEHQWEGSGIFDFMRALPAQIKKNTDFTFSTPSDVLKKLQPTATLSVPHPISWADEERDVTAWLGNNLQREAFENLYQLTDLVNQCTDENIKKDWARLQTSDHFYYMCTKFFSDGDVHMYFNPYNSPYEAFINYMNVLTDFADRLKSKTGADGKNELSGTNIDKEIELHEKAIKELIAKKTEKKIQTVVKENKKSTKVEPVKSQKAPQVSKKATKAESKTSKEVVAKKAATETKAAKAVKKKVVAKKTKS